MRVLSFSEMWNTMLAHEKSSANIDTLHQIKTFRFGLFGRCELDSRCIIDQYINTTECINGLLNGSLYLVFMTDI